MIIANEQRVVFDNLARGAVMLQHESVVLFDIYKLCITFFLLGRKSRLKHGVLFLENSQSPTQLLE